MPHAVLPVSVGNSFYAESYGAEIAVNWQVNDRWRLAASYSFLNVRAYSHESLAANPSNAQVRRIYENGSPRNQVQVHSYLDITKDLQLNASLYFVDRLAAFNIPYYVRGDVAMTWFPKKNLELTVGVQNVFDSQHVEFIGSGTTFAANTEVPRTVYGQVVFRY